MRKQTIVRKKPSLRLNLLKPISLVSKETWINAHDFFQAATERDINAATSSKQSPRANMAEIRAGAGIEPKPSPRKTKKKGK